MTNPRPETGVPSTATCLRCGKEYDPATGGDALFCAACAPAQPRISVTGVLIALNVLVFAAMVLSGVSALAPTAEELVRWGAGYGPYELGAEWWRMFTAMFIHIGLIHLALNMLCLSNIGPLTERILGSRNFLFLYLLSGVGGSVASLALRPTIVSAGASGAIFGIAGALLAILHVRRIPAIVSLRGRMGRAGIGAFIVYNLFYGFANTGIDNAAHIGGLVTGFLIALAFPIAGSHAGRVALLRSQGVLLATAISLGAGFLGVRKLHATDVEVESARRRAIAGDVAGAIEELQRILREEPRNVDARAYLGALYLDRDEPTEALQHLELALREDSTHTLALEMLGSAHWELEQWEQAVAAYARQTRLDPTSDAAFENLGAAYLNWGRPSDAIPPLERAARLVPENPTYNYHLGLALLATRQYAPALAAFHRSLQHHPDNPLVLLKRGVAYELLGKRDSARADYRRVADAPEGAVSAETRREAQRLLAKLRRD